MEREYTVFVVDDASVNRRILESALEKTYVVESFGGAAECLERLQKKIPDLFLLDVDMPEIDGFTLCRRIRAEAATRLTPIMFVSALDDLESRLAGYDAGGDDFIAKPFSFPEVKKKIEILRRADEEKSRLRGRLGESEMLASLVMSSLDEYAVLVSFLRSLNSIDDFSSLPAAVLEMLRKYQLKGALQLRLREHEVTLNHLGEVTPLEASIISHVRTLGTIESFRNRASFNFERVTVLINNMPVEDPDRCGRLRDHLAIAIEVVDAKLAALQTRQESDAARREIADALQALSQATRDFGEKYKSAHFHGSETIHLMQNELRAEFVSLGMSEVQEDAIQSIIEARTDQLVSTFDFSHDTEKTLMELSRRLNHVLGTKP